MVLQVSYSSEKKPVSTVLQKELSKLTMHILLPAPAHLYLKCLYNICQFSISLKIMFKTFSPFIFVFSIYPDSAK